MRGFIFVSLLFLGSVVLALLGGSVWWSLWMNHGWFGASGIVASLIGADGEYAYDAMQLEMTLIFWLAIVTARILVCELMRWKRGQNR